MNLLFLTNFERSELPPTTFIFYNNFPAQLFTTSWEVALQHTVKKKVCFAKEKRKTF